MANKLLEGCTRSILHCVKIFTVHCSMYAIGTRRSDMTCPTMSKTVDRCSLTSNLVCSRPYICFTSWLLYVETCEDGPEVWHMFVVSQSWAGASGIYSDRLWSRRLPCMRLLLHIHMPSLLQTRHWCSQNKTVANGLRKESLITSMLTRPWSGTGSYSNRTRRDQPI
jgi:hypothetical protein